MESAPAPWSSADPSGSSRLESALAWAVAAIAVAWRWLPGLSRSLQLDETVTLWVATGEDVVRRSMQHQFSPLAFLPWAAVARLDTSEVALRLPTVLFMLLAATMLKRTGTELGTPRLGSMALVFFVLLPETVRLATQARPYALALVAVTASTLLLVRWLRTGSGRDGAGYAVTAGVIPHLHPLLGSALLAHAAFAAFRWRRDGSLPANRAKVALVLALLLLLTLPQILSLERRRPLLTYAPHPTLTGLLADLAAPPAAGALLVAMLLVVLGGGHLRTPPRTGAGTAVLAANLAVFPGLALFAVSTLSGSSVYVPHYAAAALPGVALLLAWAVAHVEPRVARGAAALLVTLLLALSGPPPTVYEDWRGAVHLIESEVPPGAPVVLVSGLVESSSVRWLLEPESRRYLNAPYGAYGNSDRPVFAMPWSMRDPQVAEYVEGLLDALRGHPRFVLVTRGDGSGIETFLQSRLRDADFTTRRLGPVEGVFVSLFERRMSTGAPDAPSGARATTAGSRSTR